SAVGVVVRRTGEHTPRGKPGTVTKNPAKCAGYSVAVPVCLSHCTRSHIGMCRAIVVTDVAPREVRRRIGSGGDCRSDRADRGRLHPEPPNRALHTATGRAIP